MKTDDGLMDVGEEAGAGHKLEDAAEADGQQVGKTRLEGRHELLTPGGLGGIVAPLDGGEPFVPLSLHHREKAIEVEQNERCAVKLGNDLQVPRD